MYEQSDQTSVVCCLDKPDRRMCLKFLLSRQDVIDRFSCDKAHMRKPAFCICENKDADQLRGNREADQPLCFRYMDSTIPLLSKSEVVSIWSSSVVLQPGLCWTRSETQKTGFHTTRLIYE